MTSSAPNLNFKYEKGITISFSSYLFRLNGRSKCGGSNIEFGVRKLPKRQKRPAKRVKVKGGEDDGPPTSSVKAKWTRSPPPAARPLHHRRPIIGRLIAACPQYGRQVIHIHSPSSIGDPGATTTSWSSPSSNV